MEIIIPGWWLVNKVISAIPKIIVLHVKYYPCQNLEDGSRNVLPEAISVPLPSPQVLLLLLQCLGHRYTWAQESSGTIPQHRQVKKGWPVGYLNHHGCSWCPQIPVKSHVLVSEENLQWNNICPVTKYSLFGLNPLWHQQSEQKKNSSEGFGRITW